ncbi:hypothetical protein [Rubripirellula tenax]|nr:hypothetical protein [Rubripirellula tenax]
MMLSTHFGNFKLAPSVKQDVSELMLGAVERFQNRIRKVQVTVRDVHGPKGGIDKQCRCVVHLKRMPSIVIEDADDNYGNLFHRVADRVSYTLSQKVDRVQKGSRSRKHHSYEAE